MSVNVPSFLRIALVSAAVALALPPSVGAEPMPQSFAELAERALPAVVNISTTQKVKSGGVQLFGFPNLPDDPQFEPFREFFDRFGSMQGQPMEREVTSLGSGFIVDAKGYVITNNHVIDDAEDITVTLHDNSKLKASVVGRDPKVDLALLKVEAKKDLPFVTFGNSDGMRVGDWVVAIGNPFGLGGSVTQGIISARERSINAGPFDDFLQTDAPINRGNSGGPLFNTQGEVIGINTAIFSPSGGSVGIGFAIPAALAKPIIEQLKAYGRTHRGWLGVKIQEVSEEIAESVGLKKPMGALVLDITEGGPADNAGLKTGDVVTALGGKDITEMRFLPRMVAASPIGKRVPLTYWRGGVSATVDVLIGEMEDEAPGKSANAKNAGKDNRGETAMLGINVAPLTPEFRHRLSLEKDVTGLVVTEVTGNSEAGKRGIRPGDVIRDVGGEAVATVAQLKTAFAKIRSAGRKFALVKILRKGEEAFVTLPVGEK